MKMRSKYQKLKAGPYLNTAISLVNSVYIPVFCGR